MKQWQKIISVAATLFILGIGVTGCFGPSPDLDPVITWNLDNALDLQNFPSGATLNIKADVAVSDATKNGVVNAEWSIIPDPLYPAKTGIFLVTAPYSLQNVWQAPNIGKDEQPVNIVLKLHVKTKLGGETTSELNIRVIPRTSVYFAFDYDNIFKDSYVPPKNPFLYSNVESGKRVKMLDIPFDASKPAETIMSDIGIDGNATFEWSATPDVGAFDNANIRNPSWTAPVLTPISNPAGGFTYPAISVKVSVKIRTPDGNVSINSMIVNVVKDLASPNL